MHCSSKLFQYLIEFSLTQAAGKIFFPFLMDQLNLGLESYGYFFQQTLHSRIYDFDRDSTSGFRCVELIISENELL